MTTFLFWTLTFLKVLKEISEDRHVGVISQYDLNYLAQVYDIRVASTFDIRFMRGIFGCHWSALIMMFKRYSKLKRCKSHIPCSNIQMFEWFTADLKAMTIIEEQITCVRHIYHEYCLEYIDVSYETAAVVNKAGQCSSLVQMPKLYVETHLISWSLVYHENICIIFADSAGNLMCLESIVNGNRWQTKKGKEWRNTGRRSQRLTHYNYQLIVGHSVIWNSNASFESAEGNHKLNNLKCSTWMSKFESHRSSLKMTESWKSASVWMIWSRL